jgi:polyisoprenoid-binding protein YceI
MKKDYLVFGLLAVIIIVGVVLSLVNRNTDSDAPARDGEEVVMDSEEAVAVVEAGASDENAVMFDPEESSLVWTGEKKIIVDWIDEGTVDLFAGYAVVEDGLLVDGAAVIDMTSIEATRTGKGDGFLQLANHLKSDDFFAVESYPVASIDLTDVAEVTPGVYEVVAKVTIKGVTKEVPFVAALAIEGNEVTVSGQLELDRSEFDVRFGSDSFFDNLGDNVIDDIFTLDFVLKS